MTLRTNEVLNEGKRRNGTGIIRIDPIIVHIEILFLGDLGQQCTGPFDFLREGDRQTTREEERCLQKDRIEVLGWYTNDWILYPPTVGKVSEDTSVLQLKCLRSPQYFRAICAL